MLEDYACDKHFSVWLFNACKSMGGCMKSLKRLFGKVFGTDENVPFSTMVITLLPIFLLLGFPFLLIALNGKT